MNKKHGFTVIEIVLVFAIAGVIFLMAFIALPSLWASERDAERRANVIELVSDIKTYQTNNSRGALPAKSASDVSVFALSAAKSSTGTGSNWVTFARDYIDSDITDPTSDDVTLYVANCLSSDGKTGLSVGQPCAYGGEFKSVNSGDGFNVGVNYIMYIIVGAICDGNQVVRSSNDRDVSVAYILERGGRYCYSTTRQ